MLSPIVTTLLETALLGANSGWAEGRGPSPSRARAHSHPTRTRLSGHNAPVLLSSTLGRTRSRDTATCEPQLTGLGFAKDTFPSPAAPKPPDSDQGCSFQADKVEGPDRQICMLIFLPTTYNHKNRTTPIIKEISPSEIC